MSNVGNATTIQGDPFLYRSLSRPRNRVGMTMKLVFDVTVAALMIVLLSPVFLIVAAAVGSDGGPVLYSHSRVGRGGRLFRCFKFRSMTLNNDQMLEDYLAAHPVEALAWAVNRKLLNDPRVTRVGRFLRKTSLDELPQLLNVLRMDMSLVGPRPIVQQEVTLYGAHIAKYQHFRPGLTGLWQISGRSDTSFSERVRFDARYAEGWSFWMDLAIIARTVPAVVRGAGAR